MVFKSMLVITALCGGCIGAALSHVPGKRGSGLLRALLLMLSPFAPHMTEEMWCWKRSFTAGSPSWPPAGR